MTDPLPPEALATATRRLIEEHKEWDSLHHFVIRYRDENGLRNGGTWVALDPAIHPDNYPQIMARMAAEEIATRENGELPYAYFLQIEGFGVTQPRPGADEADRRQFDADRTGRRFYTRPDAVEVVMAWCADTDGRMWSATEPRNKPDHIEEGFYPPGSDKIGGQMPWALLRMAAGTALLRKAKESRSD